MPDRKPIGPGATCEECGVELASEGVSRPVNNVSIIVCPDHTKAGKDAVLVGGEVIVVPKKEDVDDA